MLMLKRSSNPYIN